MLLLHLLTGMILAVTHRVTLSFDMLIAESGHSRHAHAAETTRHEACNRHEAACEHRQTCLCSCLRLTCTRQAAAEQTCKI